MNTRIHTNGALKKLAAFLTERHFAACVILCDQNTLRHCLPTLVTEVPRLAGAEVIETESGEQAKTLEVAAGIWQTLSDQNAGRDTLLVNLGGGVICDLGGFCAALYKRGMPFVHVPTTVLAMADAAIGGKTGVDLAHVKNMVGVFAQPASVFIESSFLTTLDGRQVRNGFAEIIKIALACDRGFFEEIEKKGPGLPMNRAITRAAKLKLEVVRGDPYDRGVRKALNAGHSVGHALEGYALATGRDLLHGEAVAAGLVAECHISWQKRMMTKKNFDRVARLIATHVSWPGVEVTVEMLRPYLDHDKKNVRGGWRFALVGQPGSCRLDVPVKHGELERAIEFLNRFGNGEDYR